MIILMYIGISDRSDVVKNKKHDIEVMKVIMHYCTWMLNRDLNVPILKI